MVELSTFGDRLRFARESRDLKAAELSVLAGLKSKAHVGMIERNPTATPQADTAAKLAGALHISLAWLITGEGEMEMPPAAANGDG
jgi:transcriptional regulator with XRE-family HTH domain